MPILRYNLKIKVMKKFNFVKLSKEEDDTSGSSLKGKLKYGIKYDDLVDIFGPPTYYNESGDGKVQKEWVVEFNDELFTIYDWKTYSVYETKNTLDTWSIGGKSSASGLVEYLKIQIDKMELPF